MNAKKLNTIEDLIEYCDEKSILKRTFITNKSKTIYSKTSYKYSEKGNKYKVEEFSFDESEGRDSGYRSFLGYVTITLVWEKTSWFLLL